MKKLISRLQGARSGETFSFKDLIQNYGGHVATAAFLIGFIIDFLALPRVDSPLIIPIGIMYLAILAVAFILRLLLIGKATTGSIFASKLSAYFTLLIALISGSLLSYVFVLFFRSADSLVTLPFFFLAGAVILANEFISTKRDRSALDLCVFYFGLTAFCLFATPLIVGAVSSMTFYVSLILASLLSYAYALMVDKFGGVRLFRSAVVYLLPLWAPLSFLLLDTIHAIPPVPVSLVEQGIYRDVKKDQDGNYQITAEVVNGKQVSETFTFAPGESAYFYSSVFAPASLKAPVAHRWEYWNEGKRLWEERANVVFTVRGGRDGGYRGYSKVTVTTPGTWRVVVTLNGTRTLSSKTFSISTLKNPQQLSLTK